MAVHRATRLGDQYGDTLRLGLPPGEAGTWATVDAMRALVDDAVQFSPDVQRVATAIVASAPRRDVPGQLQALWQFMRSSIVFKRDPLSFEHLRHPDQLLTEIVQQGRTSADCDDVAMLGAALLRAMGFQAYFVLASRRQDGAFQHVFFAAGSNGQIVPLDPQENEPPGQWPAVTRREIVEA